jgi:TonB family protein
MPLLIPKPLPVFVEIRGLLYLVEKGCNMKLYQLIAEILGEGLEPLRKPTIFVRMDDMVFAGREQDYGAYALRRKYPWHLVLALGMVTQLVWLGVFLPVFLYEKAKPGRAFPSLPPGCCCIDELRPPPPPPPPVKGECYLVRSTHAEYLNSYHQALSAYGEHLKGELAKKAKPEPVLEESDPLIDVEEPEPWVCDFPGEMEPVFVVERLQLPQEFLIPDPEVGEDSTLEVKIEAREPQFSACGFVDEDPRPINLDEIQSLLHYPERLIGHAVSGTVVVRMLVGKKGEYLDHKVLFNPHPALAQAVGEQLPKLKFTPAIQGGKPIKFWVNIPFSFQLLK